LLEPFILRHFAVNHDFQRYLLELTTLSSRRKATPELQLAPVGRFRVSPLERPKANCEPLVRERIRISSLFVFDIIQERTMEMHISKGQLIAAAASAILSLASSGVLAATPTQFQKAELAQLSPAVRSQVEARMTGTQTVRGIIETMLLNSVSEKFAAKRVVAVDFDIGVAVVEGKDGHMMRFPFEIPTLIIKN
jgi:hypothetical protein